MSLNNNLPSRNGFVKSMKTNKMVKILKYLLPYQSWNSSKLHRVVKNSDEPYLLFDNVNSFALGTVRYIGQLDGKNSEYYWEVCAYPAFLDKFSDIDNRVDSEDVLNLKYPICRDDFKFRSPAEVFVADAFKRRKVAFFVNATCKVCNRFGNFCSLEVDFLVFYNKSFRVLEVDGKTYHRDSFQDYKRDRILSREGIETSRFTADECMRNADLVVDEFLELF